MLNRSPDELIEEIILVDDASTLTHLGERLDKVSGGHHIDNVYLEHKI